MMRLNIAPAPWPGAPVVVLSAGLGGGGGYWLAQRAALEEQYQLVSYDHNGTGENAGPLPADYSLATMAGELFSALQAAIPGSQLVEMPWGGHACNVTDADTFNTILRDGLSAMLPVARETR
ncbi:TPA: hypothetical protein QIM77_004417 [Klebsiella pneumoniae subsp. pneumoniae]|nr:hypothetical protein [Klebsiella pneumoniae subsp. pneumoniae]